MTASAASEHFEANPVLTWHPITADPVDPVEVPLNEHIAWYPEELGEFRLSIREVPPAANTTSTGPVTDWISPRSCSQRIRLARWLRFFPRPQRNATSSRSAAMGERLRWKIVDLVTRLLPGQCWAQLVSWALDGPRHERRMDRGALPWRPIDNSCRSELPRTGTCYCGALRADVPAQLADQLRTECCHAPVAVGPCMPGESDEEYWLFDLRCAQCGRDVGTFVEPSRSWVRPSREPDAAADAAGQVGGS